MLAQGKWGTTNLTGYAETDFLAAGTTSNNNQSNSYVLRQRQLWGQAAFANGWTVTGGQMWSLVTETRKGLDNRSEALPMQIDPNYTAGFSWSRQYGFRVTKNFHNKVWLGFSMEDSTDHCSTASGNASNFVIGGAGNLGGLFNNQANYSSNVSPDFVAKLAFEPGFGHYEIFGVGSAFPLPRLSQRHGRHTFGSGRVQQQHLGRRHWRQRALDVLPEAHRSGRALPGRQGRRSLRRHGIEQTPRSIRLVYEKPLAEPCRCWRRWSGTRRTGTSTDTAVVSMSAKTWYLNASGKPVGYGSPLFNNTGCGTETLPTAGTGFAPGALASCVGQTHEHRRRHDRILVQALQRTERAVADGIAVFVPYARRLGRLRHRPLRQSVPISQGHHCANGDREHVVYLVPVLPALRAKGPHAIQGWQDACHPVFLITN